MAENGERAELKGSFAGQSISVVTKDVLPILLLLGIFVLGVLAWKQNEKRQDAFQGHHVKFYEMLGTNRDYTREETDRLMKALLTVNWNCTHDADHQLPLGMNGVPAKPPSP